MLDRVKKIMNFTFQIHCADFDQFVTHWSSKYFYADEHKYDSNIGNPLTERSRLELFEWKNGSVISEKKTKSIMENYPLSFQGDHQGRYLNHRQSGGPIWNIFYIHCLEPETWPIFDQHVFRAMRYIQTQEITEIGNTKKRKYQQYTEEYIPFIKSLGNINHRTLDKALFSFGQFLKKVEKYA